MAITLCHNPGCGTPASVVAAGLRIDKSAESTNRRWLNMAVSAVFTRHITLEMIHGVR